MDVLRPVMEQISKLWGRVDLMPVIRWGTVTQAVPLRLQLDGDAEPLPLTPQTTLPALHAGDRVICVEQHRRVVVVQAAGLRDVRSLPDARYAIGPSSFTVTAAASSWQNVGLSLAYTPPADLWVDVEVSAEVAGGTGATISYTMIGVDITGGVTLGPDAPPDGGPVASQWTRFSFSPVHTAIENPTKRVLLPGGVETVFTFWARRNAVPSAGSNVCNYSMITLQPVRWA